MVKKSENLSVSFCLCSTFYSCKISNLQLFNDYLFESSVHTACGWQCCITMLTLDSTLGNRCWAERRQLAHLGGWLRTTYFAVNPRIIELFCKPTATTNRHHRLVLLLLRPRGRSRTVVGGGSTRQGARAARF